MNIARRGWYPLGQLEEELDAVARTGDQMVEVLHFMGGEDSPRRLGSLGRLTQRPLKHSHLKKHTAVARATAGKVLASRCARQGQSTRRGLSSPPMK